MTDAPIEPLPWDSEFFGFAVGRVVTNRLDDELAGQIVASAAASGLRCLYFLADADDLPTAHAASKYGFEAVDLRLELEWVGDEATAAKASSLPPDPGIRSWREEDLPALEALARNSHGASRFYHDRRFPAALCDQLYARWVEAGCRGRADEVLVAQWQGEPVGYLVGRLGHIDLIAVAAAAQGHGLGWRLVAAWLRWLAERGVHSCRVVTQGRNVAALRLYQRSGFLPVICSAWYHRWFDEPGSTT